MKRIITLILSITMLLTPVLGSAEATDGFYYFSLSNPVLSIPAGENNMDINLTGLELLFAAEESASGAEVLLSVLGNGKEALSGYMSIGEDGIYAIVDGMKNSFGISGETLKMLTEQLGEDMPNIGIIGGADGPTNIIVTGEEAVQPFTEEALAAFAMACMGAMGSIEMTEPADDVLYGAESEVPAERVDFAVGEDAIITVLKAGAELLMSNEQIAEGYRMAFESEGEEYVELPALIDEMANEIDFNVEGSVYTADNGDIYIDVYVNAAEAGSEFETMNVTAYSTSDEEGQYFYMTVLPPDGATQTELTCSISPSTEVEGANDFYFDITSFIVNEDSAEPEFSISFYSLPFIDENGVNNNYSLDITADDETVSFGLITYGDMASHGGLVYVNTPDGMYAYIGYDGAASEDGNSESGIIWAEISQNDETLGSFRCDLSFGHDVSGESIAYDFSSVPFIDVTTMDDATSQAMDEDLTNVAIGGLGVLGSEIPILGMLLSMSGITG